MKVAKQQVSDAFILVIGEIASSLAVDYQPQVKHVVCEIPPNPKLGDLAFPLFPFSRYLRSTPTALAQRAATLLQPYYRCQANGSYLNVFLDRRPVCLRILQDISAEAECYGCQPSLAGQKIMIEFSSPNTNKPLHLGHLRNNTLGEASARLLGSAAAEVYRVNLINDRGVHICKSMLAYRNFADGETPESSGLKGDHLIGKYYTRYNQWLNEQPEIEQQAQTMLQDWENGDKEVRILWQQLNQWALEGLMATYQRTGIHFDKIYRESETYQLGKDIVEQGLKMGVFERRSDAAVQCDLSDQDLDCKVVQRSDGTSVYITQDLGTAVARYQDFPFNRLIYVVGSEQNYHFKVLFLLLQRLGYPWAKQLYHLSYGMVNLPEGKMKSREGTVIDADQLLDHLQQFAQQEIEARTDKVELLDRQNRAQALALGALHYYLLRFNPNRDILFKAEESLAFSGNTGPYLQYVGSRLCSLLHKANWPFTLSQPYVDPLVASDYQIVEQEWQLLKALAAFPAALAEAVEQLNPALLAAQLYEIAKAFSRFYHDLSILPAEEPARSLRLQLCQATLTVQRQGMYYLLVPFLEKM